MRRDTPIYLISESYTLDDYGIPIPTQTKTKVFGTVSSVTGKEWFEGGRSGLNPEYRIEIYPFEYNGEKILEKDGMLYSIYRTYQAKNDSLELYVERKQGDRDDEENHAA